MKKLFKTSVLALPVLLASCDNDDNNTPAATAAETVTVSNLYAPQSGGQGQPVSGAFTKFSFSQNATVTDDSWDIAFRGTSIIVNGGTVIGVTDEPARTGVAAASTVTGTFASVTAIPAESTFTQDATGTYAISNWYNYDAATHIISPVAGKVYVVKTHDGKYAKFEILSYYKDAPASPEATSPSRYYTFKFAYKPNDNTTF